MCRNRNFHALVDIYSCWLIQLFQFIPSWIIIKTDHYLQFYHAHQLQEYGCYFDVELTILHFSSSHFHCSHQIHEYDCDVGNKILHNLSKQSSHFPPIGFCILCVINFNPKKCKAPKIDFMSNFKIWWCGNRYLEEQICFHYGIDTCQIPKKSIHHEQVLLLWNKTFLINVTISLINSYL